MVFALWGQNSSFWPFMILNYNFQFQILVLFNTCLDIYFQSLSAWQSTGQSSLSLPLILLTSRLHVMWKSKTAWTLVKLYWQVDLSHLHVPSIIFRISLIVNDYMHIVHYCEFFLAKLVILLGVASQTEESSSPSRKTWLKHLGS